MAWAHSSDKRYIYCLSTSTTSGYRLVVADLAGGEVYEETLNGAEVNARGEPLDFALSTPAQIARFVDVLRAALATDRAEFALPASCVSVTDHEVYPPLSWTFKLCRVDAARAAQTLARLCAGLLTAAAGLAAETSAVCATIASKNQLLRGLDDAVRRRVEYRVPRHLEAHYRERQTHFPAPTENEILTAIWKHWPEPEQEPEPGPETQSAPKPQKQKPQKPQKPKPAHKTTPIPKFVKTESPSATSVATVAATAAAPAPKRARHSVSSADTQDVSDADDAAASD